MAVPASPVFVNPGNDLAMAALAILQNYRGPMIGDANGFGDEARVKGQGILYAVHGLPQQVVGQVVVGQMAIHALDVLVGPGVKPGLILRLQYVAAAAKIRGFRLGVEPRRAKSDQHREHRGGQHQNN